MAEFPALPLFTDAYLADTRHLTTEEHGAYLLLLICAWRTRGCQLRDDEKMLAKLVGVSLTRWRRMRPLIAEFFDVSDGVWQQKKLTDVYETVAEKVAKNRLNGAKGGRVRAARAARIRGEEQKRDSKTPAKRSLTNASGQKTEAPQAIAQGNGQATKAKTKTKEQQEKRERKSLEGGDWCSGAIAAAAGLSEEKGDEIVLAEWQMLGCDLHRDVLPVIRRLYLREKAKGRLPGRLSYYNSAVKEAYENRMRGVASEGQGNASTASIIPLGQKLKFNTEDAGHWQHFLGGSESRFQGDYKSKNWLIGLDHPVFQPADLGPNPWHRFNPAIPPDIYADYGPVWHWCSPPAKQAAETEGR